MLNFFDGERARLLSTLSPVKRLAFRYLWGSPEQTPSEEESSHDDP